MPTDRPLSPQELTECQTRRSRMMTKLRLTSEAPPDYIVAAVDAYVDAWQQERSGFLARFRKIEGPDPEQLAFDLGVLWGDQLVRAMGWEWAKVIYSNADVYGVVNPDRSLAVLTVNFLGSCLKNPKVDCTAMLSYNMLMAGKDTPSMPPQSYTDYMRGVARIIPKS